MVAWLAGIIFVLVLASFLAARQRRLSARYLRLIDAAPGAADGFVNGVPLVEAAAAINTHVVDALNRWTVHSTDTWSILSYVRDHHAAIFSTGGHFVDGLKGYVAESIVGDHFAALGHHVTLATTTNQPGWDLLIDGQAFQVKSGTTAARMAHEHLLTHPDIPVITDFEAAHQLAVIDPHSVVALHDIGAAKLEATTVGTLHGIDSISHAGSLHFPMITAAISSYQEISRLSRGHTTFETAIQHIAVDVAGTGIGMAAGGKVGAGIGARFAGLHGAGIGGFVGVVIGGTVGKLAAVFAKEKHLRSMVKDYRIEVATARVSLVNAERVAAATARRELAVADGQMKRERKTYSRKLVNRTREMNRALRFARRRLGQVARRHATQASDPGPVWAAIRMIGLYDRDAVLALLTSAEAYSDQELLLALRSYVALYMELETLLCDEVLGYNEIVIAYDMSTRTSLACILKDLSAFASEIFERAEVLRCEIQTELRKLGKPVPEPLPGTPSKG